jgi:hypothetical protein
MRSLTFIGFILLILVQGVYSQPSQTIRGKVVDQESRMPLFGANVIILEAGPLTGVITDEAGLFMIEEVPVGRYNIMVSHIGYKSFIMREVLVGTGKEVFVEVGMKEIVLEMEGVSVSANISKDQAINPMAGISARSFTVEETEKYAGSWGDPARMASNYAGVFPNGDIYNYLVIRGNSPYGLIWRMEGIPIPNPNHFDVPGSKGGPVSIINNKQLTQSDFITSAFPAEYNNGVSGVFDLRLREGNNQRHEFVGEVGLMGVDFGAEGPISKKSGASYMVNVRFSLLGLVEELLWVGALPHYQDINFKVNFPTKKGKISVFGFAGNSRIESIRDDSLHSTPAYKRQMSQGSGAKSGVVGLKHIHFLSDRTRLVSDIAVSRSSTYLRYDSLVNDEISREVISNTYQEDKILISSKIRSKLNAKNSLNTGLSLENNFVDYYLDNEVELFSVPGGDSLVKYPPNILKNDKLFVFNGFIEWKHRFNNSLELYTGLNYTHFFMNNSSALEPRASLRWYFSDNQTISLGYGSHSQLHPFFYYFIRTLATDDKWDRENYTETNLDLGLTRSHHFSLGYDLAISRDLRFKAEAYQQILYNIPVERRSSTYSLINLGAGSNNNVSRDSLVNEGTGKNLGIEFTFEKFLSRGYYFLITTSLLDSKYQGSDGITRNTAFNSNLNVNALTGYEIPVKQNGAIDLNFRVVSAGGRRVIPHDEEKTLEEEDDVYIYDEAFEQRLATYFRIDVRAGYKHNGPRIRHEVAMDITNITNRQNEWERQYNSSSGEIEMAYQQGIFFFLYYRIIF